MPSTQALPAVVLVHGSWHVPAHYARFTMELRKAGFDVSCPLLPSCDATKHAIADLYTDAAAVRDIVEPLVHEEKEVVLVLHSSGGAVGAEAVKGLSKQERTAGQLPGGVVHIIYMCGFMLQIGGSVGATYLPRPEPDPIEAFPDGTTFPRLSPISLFYGDVEPEYAKEMESLLVRHSSRGRTNKVTHEPWRCIATTYIRTEEDNALFTHWQDGMIKVVRDAGVDLAVKSYKSSHSPFLSMTSEMVEAVQQAALGRASA